jgi:hypothetical protein
MAALAVVVILAACVPDNATWDRLAACESGGNWQAVDQPLNRVGSYGGLLMTDAMWVSGGGGFGHANAYSREQQIAVANVVYQNNVNAGLNGFTPWARTQNPATSCPARLGLWP